MSRIKIGILGAIALSLSVGAAQLALGRDDLSQVQPQVQPGQSSLDGEISVNRGAKADRAMKAPVSHVETRTVALQLTGFSDRSFLVRVPIANGVGKPQAPSVTKPGNPRLMVACEPVVSMLVDEARQLQPGRCVT
ncbi:MAG: hypothetical protein WA820_26725 [Bradyrhizobium sp.]|jgi:hypothetical protein